MIQVRSVIYGPDDRITAAIASWQLMHGNRLFKDLSSHLSRSLHRRTVYFEGEERNNGLATLNIDDWALGRWKLVESFWEDFLQHVDQLFMLDFEYVVVGSDGSTCRRSSASKRALGLLRTRLEITDTTDPIPDSERPFLVL